MAVPWTPHVADNKDCNYKPPDLCYSPWSTVHPFDGRVPKTPEEVGRTVWIANRSRCVKVMYDLDVHDLNVHDLDG